jgi:prepilin-type N-terminal cleavage/methylation domain-containing protein
MMKISNLKSQISNLSAFTLIELLVVISIVGILIGLSIFGLQGARASSRDARRKADLELIRSGLQIYKADCDKYPTTLSTSLIGDGSTTSCSSSNTYISQVPTDPTSPNADYAYSSDGVSYSLCAALEQVSGTPVTCGGSSSCGGKTCNYKVTNP